jgi:hypothetical protein
MSENIRENLGSLTFGDRDDFDRWFAVGTQSGGVRARAADNDLRTTVGGLPIHVDCPKCQRMTTIHFGVFSDGERQGRWACPCGYVLRTSRLLWSWPRWELSGSLLDNDRQPVVISPLPPREGRLDDDLPPIWLRLSLQRPCAGEILWVFNEPHLSFIENYVGAKLRERLPNMNRSLASRLPKWMLSAKNRDAVMDATAELRAMLVR